MKMRRIVFMLSITASIVAMPHNARPQALLVPDAPTVASTETTSPPPEPIYSRPTHGTMVKNFAFDAFGPYPVVAAGFTAGISQWTNSPPEWRQGAEGYGKRLGSDFGMAATATTTRYALSEALKEDTLYYRCECSGVFPRLGHAVISTVTARHGRDGRRTFSISALIAPYTGSTVAVYGWYPDRYGAKDAFRMGNYKLLTSVGSNVALEFLYHGPRALLSRIHRNNRSNSPDPGPNQ